MVPPASVLTNNIFRARPGLLLLAAALCVGLVACSPPGPRALLQGKKLVDEGHPAEAVPKLLKATTLLPKYAPGWNYLGLAYQGSGQPQPALRAYQTALSLDHKLAAAHYNIGCLYLDQTNLPPAIDELRSYTLLQPSALHGWLKLAKAQLQARRLDDAEKSYRAAMDLQARHPEALNGLGLVQAQRRRWQEALNYFNAALAQDPNYAPALLNSGLVSQQQFGARSQALKRYRQYLDLQPPPAAANAVAGIVRQLEVDLGVASAPVKPLATNSLAQFAPKTNTFAGLTPVTRTPTVAVTPALRTNALTPSGSQSKPAESNTAVLSNVTVAAAKTVPPDLSASQTPSTSQPPRPVPSRPPEVTQVPEEIIVTPPKDSATAPGGLQARSVPASSADVAVSPVSPKGTNAPKKSFFAKLNPFSGRSKTSSEPVATIDNADVKSVPPPVSSPVAPEPPALVIPRYTYLSPAKPSPGDRTEADKAFRRGIKAQQAGDRTRAITEYQAALQSDPAFFNAYYNLGLAALDGGNMRLSLAAYETALALNSESADARYNFALALKSAGYFEDAAAQLLQILAASPDDARAHLAVANIYSQQLRQPRQAREHYLRVLELNPRHAEATKIRFWLAANP